MKKIIFNVYLLIIITLIGLSLERCSKKKSMDPIEPEIRCDNKLAEDTTRTYRWPISRDTLQICTDILFARFYPWMQDTSLIRQRLQKYHLQVTENVFWNINQQWAARLCITDGRRAEYYFTPYGKTGYCNFGLDSLVEYAFGIFDGGTNFPSGRIYFRFNDNIPQGRIDSLFITNGLRFLYKIPEPPTSHGYYTVVTNLSVKNVLDLGYELQFVSFALRVDVDMLYDPNPPKCK